MWITYEGHSIKIVACPLFSSLWIKPTEGGTRLHSELTSFDYLEGGETSSLTLFCHQIISNQNYVRQGQYCMEVIVKLLTLYL